VAKRTPKLNLYTISYFCVRHIVSVWKRCDLKVEAPEFLLEHVPSNVVCECTGKVFFPLYPINDNKPMMRESLSKSLVVPDSKCTFFMWRFWYLRISNFVFQAISLMLHWVHVHYFLCEYSELIRCSVVAMKKPAKYLTYVVIGIVLLLIVVSIIACCFCSKVKRETGANT